MGSVIKVLFFLIFFGVWIFKISKKFSEMKNTQTQAAYSTQRKERIPQSTEESFPELDFEKEQEVRQTSTEPVYEADQNAVRGFLRELNLVKEDDYIQPEVIEENIEDVPDEKFKKPLEEKAEKVPEAALANDSWKTKEVISTLSIDASDARTGIIMSEILGKPIALR
jgi:hypothetical protein